MVTLSSCLIWQKISLIRLNNSRKYCDRSYTEDLQKAAILAKKIIFSAEAHWWVCKQAKLSHLKHRKPARIHWKADGFWSRGIIGTFFFENEQGEVVTVNDNRYRAMLNEFLFTKTEGEDIGNILISTGRRYVPHSRSYIRCFPPYFWKSHYQPQSWCCLAASDLWFGIVGQLFVGCHQR